MVEVSDWHLETDTISRQVYFVMGVVVLLCKEIEDPLELEVGKEILVIRWKSMYSWKTWC